MHNRINQSRSLTPVALSLIGVTVILMVVNVAMSARVSQDGLIIDALTRHQTEVKSQIAELERQIITQSSLNDLSLKAQNLGYIAPTTTIAVTDTVPLAFQAR